MQSKCSSLSTSQETPVIHSVQSLVEPDQLLTPFSRSLFCYYVRRKSHSQILKAIGGWKTTIDQVQSMDAVDVQENGDFLKADSKKTRATFYKKLETDGVKVSKIRQEVAVETMARVIKRIKTEYDMNAVEYFKIISHNQKEISMLWDVFSTCLGIWWKKIVVVDTRTKCRRKILPVCLCRQYVDSWGHTN